MKTVESEGQPQPQSPSTNLSLGRIIAVCSVLIFLILGTMLVKNNPIQGQNDASRWATVWSLNRGWGYSIDGAPYGTIDKVRRDGHYYSSKPALLPTVVAGITGLVILATGNATLSGSEYTVIPIVLVLVNVLPFTLLVFFYGRWLRGLDYDVFTKTMCLVNAAFGTFIVAYSISLNNHTVAAIGAFFAVLILFKILTTPAPGPFAFVLCGVMSAWTVVNELAAWPFMIFTFIIALKTDRRRTLAGYLRGFLVVACAFFLTTYLATGGVIPYYLRPELYKYPGSYWAHPQGIDAANEPKWIYLLNNLIGHHGVFSLTPIFIFALIPGAQSRALKQVRNGALILAGLNFVFVVATTHNYGGVCQGPRWFIWLIPLWLFCLPPAIARVRIHLWGIGIILVATIWSVYSAAFALLANSGGPWSSSWLQNWMRAAGWIDY